MKPSDYLRKGWTQGMYARDANGNAVYETDPLAVCWCVRGAISAAYAGEPMWTAYARRVDRLTGGHSTAWNDTPGRTQAEAVALAEQVESELGIH